MMWKFNFKVAIRNFIKNKSYTVINIIGLSFGLGAFVLISLFIYSHLGYDKFHKNLDNIYRVDQRVKMKDLEDVYSCTPFPLGETLVNDYPEVKKATRIFFTEEYISTSKELSFFENNGIYVDQDFFDIFDMNLLKGEKDELATKPFSILLSDELAKKFFPDEDALGKSIKYGSDNYCQVTGIYEKWPENSSLRPDFLVSFSTLRTYYNWDIDVNWDWCMISTYILLDKGTDPDQFSEKISNLLNAEKQSDDSYLLYLWPAKKMHVQYNEQGTFKNYLILFGIVALFILVVACINFTNLSVAYSSMRIKEIAVRKVSGANKKLVVRQFMGEAMIISLVSILFAFMLAELFLPGLNAITDSNLKIQYFDNYPFFLFIIGVGLATGIVSGSYPSFHLSSLSPDKALKGKVKSSSKSPFLRKFLVVFQFILSIILISSAILMFKQMKYMKSKDLGFDKENILIGNFKLSGENNESTYNALKEELMSDPGILSISWSQNAPFNSAEFWEVEIEGRPSDQKFRIFHNHVDFNFLDVYGIDVVEGRALSKDITSDKIGRCLLNELAVKKLGWDSTGALGKIIKNDHIEYEVVGVMKDFYYFSLMAQMEPYFISYTSREMDWPNTHSVKLAANQDISKMKEYITDKYLEYFPDDFIEFDVLESIMKNQNFSLIDSIGKLISIFAIIAISIAAIGLFGLVSFVTRHRTKEIGIRKANGANTYDLFKLIVKEFLVLTTIANIIAIPLSYYISNLLLKDYAYRINVTAGIFIIACIISLGITFITVSYQISRASRSNPVDALRYE